MEKRRKLSISNVCFEHHRTALGIGEASPRITWQFEGDVVNWIQGGYSIEVSRGAKSDVFNVDSEDSVLVDWPTVALTSAESADIRVKAYGRDGDPNTEWSGSYTVETGLLNEKDWSGALMIAADRPTEVDGPHRPVLLRNEFPVNADISSARLYITAYGLYEAFINGERVGDSVLAPGWQSYSHRLVYDTYDVTELLRKGANAIGIHVGEGWFSGRIGFATERNVWGNTLGALARLVITTTNGDVIIIPTDLSWTASTSPIMRSEIYDGEAYHSSLEQPGWATPHFEPPPFNSKWMGVKELSSPVSRLVAPDGPPIRRHEEIQIKDILKTPSGKTVLDFGQNLVGWLRLTVAGPAATNITMIHVEVLQNGEIDTVPLRTAKQTDSLILSGNGTQTWEPTFTYHGFRYVQVDGWPTAHTPLDRNSVKAIVVHSDMQRTGLFECSNPLLNKLTENVVWSLRGNFMSIPTDCPQRDERLGWTGDAHAFSPTANFLYDTSGFWRGWLWDVVAEQLDNNGVVPVIVPYLPAVGSITPTAVWGDAVVAITWNMFVSFRDLSALADQYVGAKAWTETGIPRGSDGLWNHTFFQYGDWLDPKAPDDDPGAATTSSALVSDAYLVYITELLAKIESALGLLEEAEVTKGILPELKGSFGKAWIDKNGIVRNETQTGLALPLYFDLFTIPGQDKAASKRLRQIIADNAYLVGTGFAGTHLLGLALSKYNLTDVFYKMLLQTTVPSWLYQVVMNGTTTWERWDSLLPNGSVNSDGMTSFNHYAFGSVANWMFRTIGGLAPCEQMGETGWKTVVVAPVPGGGLTSARARYLSPYGDVTTDWCIDSEGFHLTLVVPPNARAEVYLPGAEGQNVTVGSGLHTFSVSGVTVT